MADGDHIFGEIYLSYQPEIQLNSLKVIPANQIESSWGIDELNLFVPGNWGLVSSSRHNVSAAFFGAFFMVN